MNQAVRDRVEHMISRGHKREDVFRIVPQGASRILDIGYGDGAFLLRLKHEKQCSELYGIEVNPRQHESMEGLIDGNWNMYLGEGDNHLDDSFRHFFNWIVMHDVLEHIYDPWYFLSYVKRYVAPGGKLLLVCPNAQHWRTIFALLHGDFPYGLDGHFNEEHIRWFTPKSMIELALLSGLKVDECHLLLDARMNKELAAFMDKNRDGRLVPMPPPGVGHVEFLNFFPPNFTDLTQDAGVDVVFKNAKPGQYPHYLAVKILLACTVAEESEPPEPMRVAQLRKRRKEFWDTRRQFLEERLPKVWKAYVWQPG